MYFCASRSTWHTAIVGFYTVYRVSAAQLQSTSQFAELEFGGQGQVGSSAAHEYTVQMLNCHRSRTAANEADSSQKRVMRGKSQAW